MPRPPLKRRKSNTKSPKGRVNSHKSAQIRQQLDRILANKPVGPRPADSDDSDKLVTRTPGSRHSNSGLRREIFASGAIGNGDKPGAYPTRAETRRNLHNDTDRIIRQSRSRSGSIPAGTPKSVSPSRSTKTGVKSRASGEAPQTVVKPARIANSSKLHQTPSGDASILGTLKPRKRQASILHLIDNEDSSLINPEDEEQFLPDDESTPLQDHKAHTRIESTPLLSAVASASRKRKLGADVTPSLVVNRLATAPMNQASAQYSRRKIPKLSPPDQSSLPSSTSPAGVNNSQDDLDIMALPQSSSPETSPQRTSPNRAHQPATIVPSTQQLQSHMPTKRRKGIRQRRSPNDLDIPEDSSSEPLEEGDESIYLPRKRAPRKVHSKDEAPKKSRGRLKLPAAPPKNPTSTTPASLRPSNISSRTPLPLTRSINAENRKLRSTSSQPRSVITSEDPDCRQSGMHESAAIKSDKPFGGFRQSNIRALRSTRSGAANPDQENIGHAPGIKSRRTTREATTGINSDESDLPLSEGDEDAAGHGNELGEARSLREADGSHVRRPTTIKTSKSSGAGHEAVDNAGRWKNKWADIDDWSLEYEEVAASTQSSSPMR